MQGFFITMLYSLACFLIFLISFHANGETVISGWHLPALSEESPDPWISSDPVLGRLICPGFSRFHMGKKTSESLIFSSVKVRDESENRQSWHFQIKTGLYWWDSSSIFAKDVAAYLDAQIKELFEQTAYQYQQKISYTLKELAQYELEIIWDKKPSFGPFVFNGRPFFKKLSHPDAFGFSYQCAGIYRPGLKKDHGLELLPTKSYNLSFQKPIFFSWHEKVAKASLLKSSDLFIDFSWAESHELDPIKRPPHLPVSCSLLVPSAWMSGILWQKTTFGRSAALRQVVSRLLPRQTLAQSGAGFWAEAAFSLFPSQHPFAPKLPLVQGIESSEMLLSQLSRVLAEIGYEKKAGELMSFFYDKKDGSPFQLKIHIPSSSALFEGERSFVPEKTLVDTLELFGIKTLLTSREEADLLLSGFYLPLPQMNLFEELELSADTFYGDLPYLLKTHSLNLSHGRFDSLILEKIHSSLNQLQPLSPLLHHKSCLKFFKGPLDVGASFQSKGPLFDDPDWFRKLLF